jgi:hypothetical protein
METDQLQNTPNGDKHCVYRCFIFKSRSREGQHLPLPRLYLIMFSFFLYAHNQQTARAVGGVWDYLVNHNQHHHLPL